MQALLGRGIGALLHAFGRSRRRIALRNVELCFPEKSLQERRALVREHFGWLGRSLLERGLLWYASPHRLRRPSPRREQQCSRSRAENSSARALAPRPVGFLLFSATAAVLSTRHP